MHGRHWIGIVGIAVFLAGCHTDMWVQPKVTAFDEDDLGIFKGGTTARPIPTGAVARGWEKLDEGKYTGFKGDTYWTGFPSELELDGRKVDTKSQLDLVLKRGKERFYIYCSHCHGKTGDGKGMITQRGFVLRREPQSYHNDRLRNMPNGYFYDVITNGYGLMYSQAPRVKPDDRWAIIAYVRALQLSQNVPAAQLTAEDKKKMEEQLAGIGKEEAPKKEGTH